MLIQLVQLQKVGAAARLTSCSLQRHAAVSLNYGRELTAPYDSDPALSLEGSA